MKRAAAYLAAIAVACGIAGAARAESIFGLNMVGQRFDVGDARGAALGGFVQLVEDTLGILQYNPASLAWCRRVTFGAAGYVTSDRNRSETVSEKDVSTKLSTFTVGFPLFRHRVSASVGYRGRYDPDGTFSVPQTTSAGDPYNDVFERSGGLWTVPFMLAFDAGRYAKVGGYYSIENGTIEDRWIIDFQGESTVDAVGIRTRQLTGHGWGVGATVRPVSRLSVGVVYDAAVDYDTSVEERHTNANANADYTETTSLPERWTASAALRIAGSWTAYAGASTSDFGEFVGLAFPPERLTREQIAAIGVEYRWGGSGVPIRASYRYEQLPYTMPDGEKITGFAVGLGTGLLFRGGRGRIDTALQFGNTGSLDTNGYDDRFVRFYVSITGSESWKRKREARY